MKLAPGQSLFAALSPRSVRIGDALVSMAPDENGIWAMRIEATAMLDVEPVVGGLDPPAHGSGLVEIVNARLQRASLLQTGLDAIPVAGGTSLQRVAVAAVRLSVDLAWVLGRMELSGVARPPSVEAQTIATRAGATRRARGSSASTVARRAGVVETTVSNLEQGEWVSLATLERIASALSVHPFSLAVPL
ncbi:MAG: helix-turn-helix transcriptional regulator [Myxococcales bacterium]|nr:helix-turn-helix transcriptional regulator [Myxococcales bacterium]